MKKKFFMLLFSLSLFAQYPLDGLFDPTQTTSTSLQIKKGWNLLALPVDTELNATQIDDTFAMYETIWKYNMQWYLRGVTVDQIPLLSTITSTEGFWLFSLDEYNVSFIGETYQYLGALNIEDFQSGWYLVGTGMTLEVQTLFDSYSNIITAWKYHNGSWSVYPSYEDIGIPLLEVIFAGEGFWLHVE